MPPGVFIAAADALEYLGLSEEKWEISPTGFTVLAHPSRLDIAVNHGVYIFNSEDLGKHLSAGGATTIPVTKVLQKPSRQQLESESAIVHNSTAVKPYAYTDSAYFMGSDVVQKLLALRTSLSPLCCEIDAYGDFLQCLGTRGSPEYISDTKNVLVESDQLAIVRRLIYDTLHDSKAEALVLNNSAFYHIGTFKELLEHFCGDELFLERFSLAHKSFCCFPKSKSKILNPQSKIDGSVAFSVLAKDSATHEHSYVEFSHFPCGIEVGKNSIVSNCSTAGKETCRIPPSTFISTFALESAVSKGEVLYSTVIFNTFDNLKLKKFSAVELPFYLGTLGSSCTSLGVKIENVFDSNTKEFSLWNAKLFPTAATMDESFQLGLKMIQLLTTNNSEINSIGSNLVSMADILAFKHFDSLLNYRQQLYNLIKNP